MALRVALQGKTLIGQFTGLTGTTLTVAIPPKIGRIDPNTAVVSVAVQDASDDATFAYRITSFTSSQLVCELATALAAGDIVHVSIQD